MIIVSVIGQKGGSAKSSVARALAVTYASTRNSVQLIDLDVNQMTSTKWATTRASHEIKPVVQARVVDLSEDGLGPIINSKADVVIVDAPGWTDSATAELAKISTFLIIPSGSSMDDIGPAVQLYYDLEAAPEFDPRRAVAVLTRVATEAEIKFARAQFAAAEVPLVDAVSKESPMIRKAQSVGMSAVEVSNDTVKAGAKALTAELVKRIKEASELAPADQPTWHYQAGDEELL